jgi:low affinity Fe/Cu permease
MNYGPSAWDVIINLSGTAAGTWQVWLVQNGQQASARIQVQLQSDCSRSAAMVRFQQNH